MSQLAHRIAEKWKHLANSGSAYRRACRPYVAGKRGLEIGGPSDIFRRGQPIDLYKEVEGLDNCDFSQTTVWAEQAESFVFDEGKRPGATIICDGSDLNVVADDTYDFVLSSHNLEHFANPVKALREWDRVLHRSGALLLVLPFYKQTFDHRREPTTADHMMEDFRRGTGEDDLTHLPEILERHDLSLDPPAGTPEQFRERGLRNLENRCLHHHVFDKANSRELLERSGFAVRAVSFLYPLHLCLLATPNGGDVG